MLKIKDNVDLKELEKFGFEYDNSNNTYIKKIIEGDINDTTYSWCSEWLVVSTKNRKIKIFIDDEYYCVYTNGDTLEELYDLIKADLVEKVSNNANITN